MRFDAGKHPRTLIECEPDHMVLAIRAAEFLLGHPSSKDAIVAYGDVHFYVKRNPSSISVRQEGET